MSCCEATRLTTTPECCPSPDQAAISQRNQNIMFPSHTNKCIAFCFNIAYFSKNIWQEPHYFMVLGFELFLFSCLSFPFLSQSPSFQSDPRFPSSSKICCSGQETVNSAFPPLSFPSLVSFVFSFHRFSFHLA